MHGLPSDFDPAVFVGATLRRVTFTTNTAVFDFDEHISLTLESEVRYEWDDDGGNRITESRTVPITDSRVMAALGAAVTMAAVEGSGTLVLRLGNGHVLRFVEDTDPYESYQLVLGDREIIV